MTLIDELYTLTEEAFQTPLERQPPDALRPYLRDIRRAFTADFMDEFLTRAAGAQEKNIRDAYAQGVRIGARMMLELLKH